MTGRGRLARLDPRPNPNPVFPALDGVRALAVTMVFVSHGLAGHFLAEHANLGVTLFFVLSGFLLYRPFITGRNTENPPPLGRYFRRRVLRIVPAYWVALTVVLLTNVSGFDSDNNWQLYLFLQTYSPETIFDGIAGAWSLCVEVTFYLTLPLYAGLLARTRLRLRGELLLLASLAATSVGFRILVGPDDVWAYATLPGTLAWFAAGMALARISVDRPQLLGRARPVVLWVTAILIYLLISVLQPPAGSFDPLTPLSRPLDTRIYLLDIGFYLLSGLFALCVATAALGSLRDPVTGVLLWRPVAWLGLISYGVFLWHLAALDLASRLLPDGPAVLWLALATGIAVALAAASYYGFERRLMRLSNGRRAQRR